MTSVNQIDLLERVRQLEEENARLQVLLHIAQSLQEELELDKLLLKMMEEVAHILHADRCTVFLLDEEKNELWSIVAMGLKKGQQIRFPANKGIAGYVAQTGEVLNIPDAYKDPRFNPEIDKKTGYRTRCMLTMPLRNKMHDIIGVFQVLNKKDGPFTREDEELLDAISQIAATAIENAQLYEDQVKSFNSFIETLSTTLDARDYITAGHSRRVTLYTLALSDALGLDEDTREELRYAALLHDIGKLGIPESVLFKAGKLTDEEYALIKSHPQITREILNKIYFHKKLRNVPEIAATHHERVDGKGYPDGLKNGEIPFGGRMLCLADVFDALTSRRQYRDREPLEKVWQLIEKDSGTAFDPKCVEAFKMIPAGRIIEIMEQDRAQDLIEEEIEKLYAVPLEKILEWKTNGASNLSPEDRELLELFDKYYERRY
ncbi:MAG: GAF domain-containing protein [Calditrichaeota bacterium]|nr:GAF domain-containing protein [Calditrichota bacterium]